MDIVHVKKQSKNNKKTQTTRAHEVAWDTFIPWLWIKFDIPLVVYKNYVPTSLENVIRLLQTSSVESEIFSNTVHDS